MNRSSALDRFLRTDPRDIDCDEAMRILHLYVDVIVADEAAAWRYPGMVAHLAACGPCSDDFHGLLAAVAGSVPGPPVPPLEHQHGMP